MSRYIDADNIHKPIYAEEDNCTGIGMTFDEMDAYNDGIDAMIRQIDNVPTADVKEAVRGKWELFEEWNFNGGIRECYCAGYRCSICKEEPSEYHFFDNPDYPPKFNFCPNCGADLRGNS